MLIYTLNTCDSCRKAIRWLKENKIQYTDKPIRETPPSLVELQLALEAAGGDIKKLFNTSGQEYRARNLKHELPTLSQEEALALLASNGNLIKRPFLVAGQKAVTGFHPEIWEQQIVN